MPKSANQPARPLQNIGNFSNLLNARNTGVRFSIPRPRSLGEFIIYPSRWSIPKFDSLEKFTRRIKTNVLYFQTNYLIVTLVLFAVTL